MRHPLQHLFVYKFLTFVIEAKTWYCQVLPIESRIEISIMEPNKSSPDFPILKQSTFDYYFYIQREVLLYTHNVRLL